VTTQPSAPTGSERPAPAVGEPSLPAPPLAGAPGEYFGYQGRGELRIQRCKSCGRWLHPPRLNCPDCGGSDVGWEQVTGRGELYSWTVTHHRFSPDFEPQYLGAIVALAEGVRVFTTLRGLAPDELVPGLPVRATFEARRDGSQVVVFERAGR
jgi:uncharacterized protein